MKDEKTHLDKEGRNYLNQIFFESDIVTERVYQWYLKKVDSLPKTPRIISDNTAPSEVEEEKEFLNRNKKFSWEATSLFSLPEEAGTRQFLFIRR